MYNKGVFIIERDENKHRSNVVLNDEFLYSICNKQGIFIINTCFILILYMEGQPLNIFACCCSCCLERYLRTNITKLRTQCCLINVNNWTGLWGEFKQFLIDYSTVTGNYWRHIHHTFQVIATHWCFIPLGLGW